MTTFIGAAAAEAETLSIPAHQKDDLFFAFGGRWEDNTAITVPQDWQSLFTISAGAQRTFLAIKKAASASESFGTFTGAQLISCIVYRPTSNEIIGTNVTNTGSTLTSDLVFPLLSIVFSSSWIVEFSFVKANNTNIEAINSYALRASIAGSSGGELAVWDSNANEAVGSLAAKTLAFTGGATATRNYRAQLYDLPGFAEGGSGGFPLSRVLN